MKEDAHIVRMTDVTYRYPTGTQALKGVSLSIKRGESVAIVGSNGGGKSTLLMLMSALISPSSGSIRLFGKEITKKSVERSGKLRDIRERIGMVFQDPDVQLFSATVNDDIIFGPVNFGWKEEKAKEAAKNVMEELGISELAERHPYELSGGEKRKASIATALVYEPELLIMDEPTSDLDPASREELLLIIERMKRKGRTFVISTHDMDTALRLADRTIVLRGTILADGRSAEILSDEKLMKRAGLEVPYPLRLKKVMEDNGISAKNPNLEDLARMLRDCRSR